MKTGSQDQRILKSVLRDQVKRQRGWLRTENRVLRAMVRMWEARLERGERPEGLTTKYTKYTNLTPDTSHLTPAI